MEGGRVEGMNSLEVLRGDHTFLMAEQEVGEAVLRFLRKGVAVSG